MRNELATPIKKATMIAGAGLIEERLRYEGGKGCSEILCVAPVELEPAYEPFDASAILGRRPTPEGAGESPADEPMTTLQVYAGTEDIVALEWIETFLRALSVFSRRLAFELVGRKGAIVIRFAVARSELYGFKAALGGIFPGVRVKEVARPFELGEPGLPLVVEELVPIPPYPRTLTLIGKEGVSPLAIAYRALEVAGKDELAFYQVLAQPVAAGHDWHFNIAAFLEAERRASQLLWLGGLSDELSYDRLVPSRLEPSTVKKIERDSAAYALIVRYGMWGQAERHEEFLQAIRAATGVVRFGNNPFRRISTETFLENLGEETTAGMITKRRAHRQGLIVTSHEVASFVHLPNPWALEMFRSIERREGLEWEIEKADQRPSANVVIGTNTYAGRTVPVIVPEEMRLRQSHLLGKTGFGKSVLLIHLALSDASSGQGFGVIDPHADTAYQILARLPEDRLGDVVYVSFTEPGLMPYWNPFALRVPPARLADDFSRGVMAVGETSGPRMGNILRHAAYAVAVLGGCLADFAVLLSRTAEGAELRGEFLGRTSNREAMRFWKEEFKALGDRELESTWNKISRLLMHDELGAMFSQRENRLDPREWMDTRKIVIINLAAGLLGGDFARFVGGLLVSLIHRAALSRADTPENLRVPFFLYVDESQLVQTATLGDMLSEARKYKLGLTLSHQNLGQLYPSIADATGNCSTTVVFRPVDEDLPGVRRALMGRVNERELSSLRIGQAFVMVGNRVTSVTTPRLDSTVLRNGESFARQLAEATYMRVACTSMARTTERPASRPRIHDTFGPGGRRP